MINPNPISRNEQGLSTWLIDLAGNVAISDMGLDLLERIGKLGVPVFVSSEQAMAWGSGLNAEQREILVHIQRSLSEAAQAEYNLQRMVSLATQSQLMREAAEAFPKPAYGTRLSVPPQTLPPNRNGSRN
jgi:hypothetical protein